MKKIITFILVALTAVGTCRIFNGKSVKNETSGKPALCLVVEADNLFGFDFNQLHDEIFDVVQKSGFIRAVCADGRPFVYVDIDIPSPDKKYTKAKQRKINESLTNEIITELNGIAPKTPEDDLLSALKTGKQALGRCRDASQLNMIVISSGISRAGVMRFQDFFHQSEGRRVNSLLTANPDDIAADLSEKHSVPDLSRLDSLLWCGCGEAAYKQDIPDSAAAEIRELWSCITDVAGCQAEFEDVALSGESFDTELQSTVIDFEDDELEIDLPVLDEKFSESQFGFIANKAVLKDEGKTVKLLEPYAESLVKYSEYPDSSEPVIYVVGLTATFGDPENCKKLSLARAEKIKQLLISRGCPEALIGTLGLGQGGPPSMRTDDTVQTESPDALEALRAENRVVYLIGADSEKAKLLGLS